MYLCKRTHKHTHTGSHGLETRGFGDTKPYDVLAHIHSLYGNPSLTELEGALV